MQGVQLKISIAYGVIGTITRQNSNAPFVAYSPPVPKGYITTIKWPFYGKIKIEMVTREHQHCIIAARLWRIISVIRFSHQ